MRIKSIGFILLAVFNLIHGQDDQLFIASFQAMMRKLQDMSDTLEDVQEKLENLESSVQGLHHELEHVKGLSQDTGQCLRVDDLGYLTNVSAATHQEIKSFVHEEISAVISLADKDECSEGYFPCGHKGRCENTLFSFTCSCPSGFTWDGSDCSDIDECIQDRTKCNSNAKCTNTLGSYSCSCNPPFEGDGLTCACPPGFVSNGDICEEFPCESPAEVIRGLGCIKLVQEHLTFNETKAFCQEEGGRLLQQFNQSQLKDIRNTFPSLGNRWIGVYDEKWTSTESFIPEDLRTEGSRSDPSRRCGILGRDNSFTPLKVIQWDCSAKLWGYCQMQLLP
ncbi:uncharacterized protein [Palaemon carinicauda]|uniref:uncharacterized protein n=1 Tax=Palaemon carinicauda TaxID=392227 RepID=UPI0035B64169